MLMDVVSFNAVKEVASLSSLTIVYWILNHKILYLILSFINSESSSQNTSSPHLIYLDT